MKTLIIYAGGTFGMISPKTSFLTPSSLSSIMDHIPDSIKNNNMMEFISHDRIVDSSSMSTVDWIKIAKIISDNDGQYDSYVVLQGTDTLAYTASALSFMFSGLRKPIVVTGSMIPINRSDSDGIMNLTNALSVIEHSKRYQPIPEVIVVFGQRILRGCRARKMNTAVHSAFDSPNYPALGTIGDRVVLNSSVIRKVSIREDLSINPILIDGVSDMTVYPGMSREHLTSILSLPTIRGLVLRAYGMGTTPHIPELSAVLNSFTPTENKAVVCITQCPYGMIDMDAYEASATLRGSNVMAGRDMTPEAAMTKLMVGLAISDQIEDLIKRRQILEEYMSTDQRGEFS